MMKVIRDEEMGGLMMIPLFTQYGLHRCNVRDCNLLLFVTLITLKQRKRER